MGSPRPVASIVRTTVTSFFVGVAMATCFLFQLPPGLLTACWPGERGLVGLRVCTKLREQLLRGRVCLVTKKEDAEAIDKAKLREDLDRLQDCELSLKCVRQQPGVLLDVLATSESVRGMDSLIICADWPSSETATKVACVLSRSHTLRHLDLSHTSFGAEAARMLGAGLSTCTSLTSLEFIACNLGNVETAGVSGSGWKCSGLAHLRLANNSIGNEGASKLAEALVDCKALTDLDLSHNQIQAEGAGRLAEVLRECKALRRVSMGWNRLGDEGVERLSASLPIRCSLTHLALNRTEIGAQGVRSLRGLSALSDLDMSYNDMGDEGTTALADVLRDCRRSVARLNLGGCGIGDVGAVQLSQALIGCAALRHLDLGICSIGDEGASQLADALRGSPALMHLQLRWNQIGDEGAGRLAAVLVSCKSLKCFGLLLQSQPGGRIIRISQDLVKRLREERGVDVW